MNDPTPSRDRLQRYLRVRHVVEALAWIAFFTGEAGANTADLWLEGRRTHAGPPLWEIATWEATSNAAWLCLVPAILRMLDRHPLRLGQLRANLPWHGAAALVASALHVGLMVAARKLVYAAAGAHYDFGAWPSEMLYEARDGRARPACPMREERARQPARPRCPTACW